MRFSGKNKKITVLIIGILQTKIEKKEYFCIILTSFVFFLQNPALHTA